MRTFKPFFFFVSVLLISSNLLLSQCIESPPGSGIFINTRGGQCVTTIITAVPFLRIAPDARSAGMGDAGIAVTPYANALQFNSSNLVWSDKYGGVSLTYTPWIRSITNGAFLLDGAAYTKLEQDQVVGLSFKYFNLGEVSFNNPTGNAINTNPNEFALSLTYARPLGAHFSGGLASKLIWSNLLNEANALFNTRASFSAALDVSMTFHENDWTVGLAVSNIGPKISYSNINDINNQFIPTNLGLGVGWNKTFLTKHQLTLTMDVNKLLVPTPDPAFRDDNRDGIPDYTQVSVLRGIVNSFGDASGGFQEEWSEINFSWGIEYWYNQIIALRTGYFYEPETKGGRQYATFGIGGKYHSIGVNLSYLVPTTTERNPLKNTIRVSILYDFESD